MTEGIVCGDALSILQTLPDESVQCCVTSPPYWGLRNYGNAAQVGLEKTPDEYVNKLVDVFREVRRILRTDGTFWLNIGDSYAGATSQHRNGGSQGHNSCISKKTMSGIPDTGRGDRNRQLAASGIKMKQIVGIPWRLAFALQADGWYLRQDIIWAKPNPMPESVRDRCTRSHEYIFLLTKSAKYYYDADAIAEPLTRPEEGTRKTPARFGGADKFSETFKQSRLHSGNEYKGTSTGTRNKRDVWFVSPKPYKGAHFAVFPPDLIEPCILAGTSEKGQCSQCGSPWVRSISKSRSMSSPNSEKLAEQAIVRTGGVITGGTKRSSLGISGCYNETATLGWYPSCECNVVPVPQLVLDPFGGSGTVAQVSQQHGRRFLSIDLNESYCQLARQRIFSVWPLLPPKL